MNKIDAMMLDRKNACLKIYAKKMDLREVNGV